MTLTRQEVSMATRIAYSHLVEKSIYRGAKLRIYKRTRVGKLALEMIYKLEKDFDFEKVRQKKIERVKLKNSTFSNVFTNPIVKDYINNNSSIKSIYNDRIHFWGGRNHWAKNELDKRILKILKRE